MIFCSQGFDQTGFHLVCWCIFRHQQDCGVTCLCGTFRTIKPLVKVRKLLTEWLFHFMWMCLEFIFSEEQATLITSLLAWSKWPASKKKKDTLLILYRNTTVLLSHILFWQRKKNPVQLLLSPNGRVATTKPTDISPSK